MKPQAHRCRHGAVLQVNFVAVLFDMPFVRYTEELPYMTLVAVITVRYADFFEEEYITRRLSYDSLLHPVERPHQLKNFDYSLKRTVFKPRLRLKETNPPLANCHC